MRSLTLIIFLLLILPSACDYHCGDRLDHYSSIEVPFIKGDHKGELTSAVITALQARGGVRYTHSGGALLLCITLSAPDHENIGFGYTMKENHYTKVLAANEARIMVRTKILVKEVINDKIVFGPIDLEESMDFSFEPDDVEDTYHDFALGQLERYDLAEEAALNTLYTRLAHQIVYLLYGCW